MISIIKKSLLLFLLTLSSQLYAFGPGWICLIKEGPGLYQNVSQMKQNDKIMHCSLSCALANICGAYASMQAGVFKELIDLVGHGNSEFKDIKADFAGIRMAYSGQAKSLGECKQECIFVYKR